MTRTPTQQVGAVRYALDARRAAMDCAAVIGATMGRIASSPPPTTQALTGVLQSKGFELGDFEFEEQSNARGSDLLGVMGGLLRVRCCSTGEERMYSTGFGSAWLGAFLGDLSGGHFASATRERLRPLVLAA